MTSGVGIDALPLCVSSALLEHPPCPHAELVEFILEGVDVALQLVEGEALGRDERTLAAPDVAMCS
jgi:hypothetical protein